MRATGHYEQLGSTRYFIPDALPPKNPSFVMDTQTSHVYGEAMLHLGKLNEMAHRLPDAHRFIKAYTIKEALLSSAIEGIHTTLLEVFTQPLLESKPNKNTQLVTNYTKALDAALALIKKNGLPITSRVILKAHETLMSLGGDHTADPGHFRKQSVRVGNLTPPPPPQVPELMSDLERYINIDATLPPLIKTGLAHIQFETIHPFLDGNGRIGRMLIVLMLVENGLLAEPIVYPSYYFKKHRYEYYQNLDRVRTHGDFEGWISFYLTVIRDSSIDAYQRAKNIERLEQKLSKSIAKKKQPPTALQKRTAALSLLFKNPVINVSSMASHLNVSYNTANHIVSDFVDQGVLEEETQQKRGKLFTFKAYLNILEEDLG